MNRSIHLFYSLLWISYIAFSFYFFPFFNVSVAIPSVLLLAIGSWIYGIRGGLLLIGLVSVPYHYLLLDYYGIYLEVYQAKAFGSGIQLIIVSVSGTTKNMMHQAETLAAFLEQKVLNRTSELTELTNQLIIKDESLKLDLAQKIHDGLGQNLTGLLLYCSSLEQNLIKTNSPYSAAASSLVNRAQKNLQETRKISRTLFPIKIVETGLDTALFELTSYFKEATNVTFNICLADSHHALPEHILLHVYRIIYECILNAVQNKPPTHINILFLKKTQTYILNVDYDAIHTDVNNDNIRMKLIKYRLQQVNGRYSTTTQSNQSTMISCTIPFSSNT